MLQLIYDLSSCTRLQVMLGSTVELPCLSFQTYGTGAAISWKYNGKDISSGAQSPGSVKVKKNGLYLSISPFTAANEGEYRCSVKEDNMVITRSYNLTAEALIVYTIHAIEGLNAHLPCHFQPSTQVKKNAMWFKDVDRDETTRLDQQEGSVGYADRLSLLYPLDQDQTVILRDIVLGDTGIYHCESADGKKLSTVYLTVKVAPTEAPHTCSGFTTAWESCQDENSRTAEPMLQESMAEFSMKLYSYLRASNPSNNLLFSPISISGLLSHLLLGARGDTRRALQTAVCVPPNFNCVHDQMKKLKDKLANSLLMASQIYYNSEVNLTEYFVSQSLQFYDATPVKLLETSEDNTKMINSWVANKTNNKITQLVDSLAPDTKLILLNAVSFSGLWKMKFEQKPKKGLFTKLDGDLVKVPILYHQKYLASMAFVVPLKARVARFVLTGESSLYVLLPLTNTDLQQVEEMMTDTAVLQMIEQLKTTTPQHIEVTLPEIKLDVQPNMNILIKKLGLSSLYEDPNLCGLNSEEQLILDDARHRAFLSLTQQGVEAGAATSLSFSRSFPSFSAMRPFILLLWSDLANVPLFIGRVTEP